MAKRVNVTLDRTRSLDVVKTKVGVCMLKSVDETLEMIRRRCERLGTIVLPPTDACGHVLAEAVPMGGDSPPFDRALLDGFAVRAEDARVGASLEMIGRQDAGG